MAAGVVHIPWYATGLRGDDFADRLAAFAALAPRYGATEYWTFRRYDDHYIFQQYSLFEDPHDFERYWYGPEFSDWRGEYSSWYTVPVVYVPMKLVGSGRVGPEPNGHGAPGVSPARAEP